MSKNSWHPRQHVTRKQRRDKQHILRRRHSEPLQKAIGDSARWLAAHVERLHKHVARKEEWVDSWVSSARGYFAVVHMDTEEGLRVARRLVEHRIDEWIERLRFPPRTKGEQFLRRVRKGWEHLRASVAALESHVRRVAAARRLGAPVRSFWKYRHGHDSVRMFGGGL